jgi:hypothetical protein
MAGEAGGDALAMLGVADDHRRSPRRPRSAEVMPALITRVADDRRRSSGLPPLPPATSGQRRASRRWRRHALLLDEGDGQD